MSHAVNDEALDILFRGARTTRHWRPEPVTPQVLMAVYDLLRFGPTANNTCPARIHFVVSPEAKERLKPHLSKGNVEQTMAAPATAIVGYDLNFADMLPKLIPDRPGAKERFQDPGIAERVGRLSGALEGGYFIMAARAVGLDCGPMGGFDNDGVDKEFFAGTAIRSLFLCNVGHGDGTGLKPRAPRLSFDEACKIL